MSNDEKTPTFDQLRVAVLTAIHNDPLRWEKLWPLTDAYGEPGVVPTQGLDWSGFRDSSDDAIRAMAQVLLQDIVERAISVIEESDEDARDGHAELLAELRVVVGLCQVGPSSPGPGLPAKLEEVAAALRRRGLAGTAAEDGLIIVPDGWGGIYEFGHAGGQWAADHYERSTDEVPDEGLLTKVQSGSDDVERIAAAIVAAIEAHQSRRGLA